MPDAAPSLKISMAANLGGLELARLQARQFLDAHAVEEKTLATVELVMEECVTNTLRYGYDSTGLRWIQLGLSIAADSIQLTIEDDARAFDPLAAAEPHLPISLDEARVGGLGLLMVRRSVRQLQYARDGGRNRLSARIAREA